MSNTNTPTTLTLASWEASEAMLQASLAVFGFGTEAWDSIQAQPVQDITLADLEALAIYPTTPPWGLPPRAPTHPT